MQLGDPSVLEAPSGETVMAVTAAPEGDNGGAGIIGMDTNSAEEEKGIIRGDELGDKISSGGNRWPRQETLALLKIRSDMDAVFQDSIGVSQHGKTRQLYHQARHGRERPDFNEKRGATWGSDKAEILRVVILDSSELDGIGGFWKTRREVVKLELRTLLPMEQSTDFVPSGVDPIELKI